MTRPRNPLRDRRGVALLEFAIVLPFLILLIMGVFDLGNALQQEIRLYQAVRAGAQIALTFPANPATGNLSQPVITAAVQNAGSGLNVTATETLSCYCSDGTSVNCSSGTCTTGGVQRYIQISASAPFKAMVIPLSTLRASILERVQ